MTRVAWLVCGGLVLGGVSLPGMFGVFSVHHSTPMRTLAHAMRVLEWSMHIGWWFLAGWTLTLTLGVFKLHPLSLSRLNHRLPWAQAHPAVLHGRPGVQQHIPDAV